MPAGTYSCPIDFGSVYHVMFYDNSSQLVATATVKPDGCETVILPDGKPPLGGYRPELLANLRRGDERLHRHRAKSDAAYRRSVRAYIAAKLNG